MKNYGYRNKTRFVIHALADSWHRPYKYVYNVLNDAGILDDYIIQFYDVLHTLGEKVFGGSVNEIHE